MGISYVEVSSYQTIMFLLLHTACMSFKCHMSHIQQAFALLLYFFNCSDNQTELLKNAKIMTKSFNSDFFLQSEHKIEKVDVHEDFNSVTLENDLAVVFLKTPIKPSPYAQVAKMNITSLAVLNNQTLKFSSLESNKESGNKFYRHFPMELDSPLLCKKILRAIGSGSLVGESQVTHLFI